MSAMTDRLEALLATGADTAVLRFSLGNAYLESEPARAVVHLRRALEIDPAYSAAWKLLGRALASTGDDAAATEVYTEGIRVANERGDKQAAREMAVFLKRLLKAQT
jgi:predicted Zn-dependent protease